MTLAREFHLTPAQARASFGAARAVLEADGAPRSAGLRLLEVLASAVALEGDWRAVPAATPAEVAAAFEAPEARRVLCDMLLIPACLEGEVSAAGEAKVKAFAEALGVSSHWVRLLGPIRRRKVFAIKRQLFRRSPDAKRMLSRIWSEEGLVGVWRALQFIVGVYRDPALAARFRALGALPEGTLGKTFFDSLVSKGYSFPGEKDGFPERMMHHDLMHVINGYGTDSAGECEIAGFYAGFSPGDPFTFIVTVLTSFQLGLPVSPPLVTPTRGAFDPARVLAAFLRGRRLRVDVMGPWDYWALMPLSLPEARERLGLNDTLAPEAQREAA